MDFYRAPVKVHGQPILPEIIEAVEGVGKVRTFADADSDWFDALHGSVAK